MNESNAHESNAPELLDALREWTEEQVDVWARLMNEAHAEDACAYAEGNRDAMRAVLSRFAPTSEGEES